MSRMILPEPSAETPGPFALIGDPAIATKPFDHTFSAENLGIAVPQPSRTLFRLHAERYAFAPGDRISIFGTAPEGGEGIALLAVHDALTHRLLREIAISPAQPGSRTRCETSGVGGCGYPEIAVLDSAELPPGVLVINAFSERGAVSQPLFVLIREPAGRSAARVALMHPDFTWQAYNDEGGASFYTPPGPRPLFSVSLRRPIDQRASNDYHNARSAIPFLRLFAENGVPCRSFSNHDLHESAGFLDGVDVLVLCGHDEYWTRELRANIDAFLARGGRIACFSGNTNWWQAKLVGDTLYLSQEDREAPEPEFSGTGLMFRPWIDNPIEPQLGLGYLPGGYAVRYFHSEDAAQKRGLTLDDYQTSRGVTVVEAGHPVFAGTGVQPGDVIGAEQDVLHVEIDAANLRADGRLDRSRWKFTPRNLRVLGRALIYTASYPAMNFDPEGLFHVAAVISELPGTDRRGAALHFGSVGWYRAIAAGDPVCRKIALNAIAHLLDGEGSRPSGRPAARPPGPPAEIPPRGGMADMDRRSLLLAAAATAVVARVPAAANTAVGQTPAERVAGIQAAREALAVWTDLRRRVAAEDGQAMLDLARRLLQEDSVGSETCIEIYGLVERAAERGAEGARLLRYQLALERFDGLHPSSVEVARFEAALDGEASTHLKTSEAIKAFNARDAARLEALLPELEKITPRPEPIKIILAAHALRRNPPGAAAALDILGTGPIRAAAGLAVRGEALAILRRHGAAQSEFRAAADGGYEPARFLLARLRAVLATSPDERRSAIDELQALGRSGLKAADITAGELSVTDARKLGDLKTRLELLKGLSDRGYGNASFLVAMLLAGGVGAAQDPREAVRYMELCAASRQRFAEFQLGVWAYTGFGQPADKAAAAAWFRKASDDGEPRAMHNLALMIATGDGVVADPEAAKALMRKAAAAGVAEAADWISRNGR